MQYIDSVKQLAGSALKVLAESLKTVFDEVNFIVNLYSFLLPLALPRQALLPGETFVPHPLLKQNNFQIPS